MPRGILAFSSTSVLILPTPSTRAIVELDFHAPPSTLETSFSGLFSPDWLCSGGELVGSGSATRAFLEGRRGECVCGRYGFHSPDPDGKHSTPVLEQGTHGRCVSHWVASVELNIYLWTIVCKRRTFSFCRRQRWHALVTFLRESLCPLVTLVSISDPLLHCDSS